MAALVSTLGCVGVSTVRWDPATEPCAGESVARVWERTTPSEAGIDEAALEAIATSVESGELDNLHSLLVVRDGRLVFERYFEGLDMIWGNPPAHVAFDAKTLHDLRSVTKSVVGALVGIAHGDGSLPDLDARLADLLPAASVPDRENIRDATLRHALTMTAGLEWDELSHPYWDPRNDETAMWRADDPVAYALGRARIAAPGSALAYNGGLPTVLAAVLEEATGKPVEVFARERLWCPLGIGPVEWIRHDASGLPVAASGLRLRPRDLARFGQLMLDGGRFGGKQILPADYVRASLSAQDETESQIAARYGYLWWLSALTEDAGGHDLPLAIGNGGQRILVYAPANLVVVVTAGNYDKETQGDAPARAIAGVIEALDRLP